MGDTGRPPDRDVRITWVSTMVLQGNFRWGIVTFDTDAGVYGIGAVYGEDPNFVVLKYQALDVPWFENLVSRTGESGPIRLPKRTGLGIEIDPNVAQKY